MVKKYSSSSITRTGLEEFEKTLIDPKQKELYTKIILPNISRDPLSHVLNKRVFLEHYLNEYQRAKKENYLDGLAYILIGINEYDLICEMDDNTNDEVLNNTGQILKGSFRNKDIIGRFADDSFSIVLTEISEKVAFARAKDLIFSYSTHEMSGLYFSISAGLVYFDGKNNTSPFHIIERAEEKLDKAKLRGGLKEPLY
jgi:diguanylate cyclase (GGDEF)-like protein